MKSKRTIIGVVVLAVVLACAGLYSRSLLRSETSIRASLLRQTPLGSKTEDVRRFVKSGGWLDDRYGGSSGFLKQEAGVPATVVGVTLICGHLGQYHLPFLTDVTAFWGFDTDGRLIDVWVWKTVDAL
jgi:hypothetical protein